MPESGAQSSPLSDLRVQRTKVRPPQIDRRQLATKLGLLRTSEQPHDRSPKAAAVPQAPAPAPARRRKRDLFLSLFKPSDASIYKRKPAPPVDKTVKVPVKLPIPYRDGEHLGVIVSDARVPFSRAMHLTRRAMLLIEMGGDGAIPEDCELVQAFPTRLVRRDSDVDSLASTDDSDVMSVFEDPPLGE